MPLTLNRPPGGCLTPVVIDPVVDDGEAIRELARTNGPYFQPGRYLVESTAAADAAAGREIKREVPPGIVGPVWRGDWVVGGEARIAGVDHLIHHRAFLDATTAMTGSTTIDPEQVYVNLTGPIGGQPFSHVDIPEFRGLDRTNAPGWLLQAMGTSGLFEEYRITIVTAVAWFHSGERGYFRYWPTGPANESARHEDMWNTAILGDNDFMHHKVERSGPADAERPPGMTIDTELMHDDGWKVVEAGEVIATYADDHVRLSLSWKAKVYADDADRERAKAGVDGVTVDEAIARIIETFEDEPAATGPDALHSPAFRDQVSSRYSGYIVH